MFFAEATLLALFGGVVGFAGGALLAHQIGRSIFNSEISIQPVLFPIILAIAVLVTFAGAQRRFGVRYVLIPSLRCEVRHELPSLAACGSIAEVAARRAVRRITSMFWRMLMRAAVLRRGRAASALLAMVVAAAVATAMMNLYVDVQAKLRY